MEKYMTRLHSSRYIILIYELLIIFTYTQLDILIINIYACQVSQKNVSIKFIEVYELHSKLSH